MKCKFYIVCHNCNDGNIIPLIGFPEFKPVNHFKDDPARYANKWISDNSVNGNIGRIPINEILVKETTIDIS